MQIAFTGLWHVGIKDERINAALLSKYWYDNIWVQEGV